jgi:CheY-like chemotaxis protein
MGSTFRMEVPLVSEDAAVDTQHPSQLIAPRGGGRKVLIVDDNMDAAAALAELLTVWGYQVVVAHDGPSALALLSDMAPDIALLDIGLPVMDGYELAAQLRLQPGGERMRLIALTGYGQESDVLRSKGSGFAEHLVKPVDMERLAKVFS